MSLSYPFANIVVSFFNTKFRHQEARYSRFSFVVNRNYGDAKSFVQGPYTVGPPGCMVKIESRQENDAPFPKLHVTSAGVFEGPLYPNAMASWEFSLRAPSFLLPTPYPIGELKLKAQVDICFNKDSFRFTSF